MMSSLRFLSPGDILPAAERATNQKEECTHTNGELKCTTILGKGEKKESDHCSNELGNAGDDHGGSCSCTGGGSTSFVAQQHQS